MPKGKTINKVETGKEEPKQIITITMEESGMPIIDIKGEWGGMEISLAHKQLLIAYQMYLRELRSK